MLKNSLLVSGLTTLLALCFGFVAALWLAGVSARWRTWLLGLALVALALPPFLVTNCWLHFLGSAGVWRRWLPFNILSLGGCVWILSLLLWPIPLLATWSAWRRLEPAQLESDLAITGGALLRGWLLPLARPALAQAAVLTFVLALNNFAVPTLLQVRVFPAEVWIRFNTEFDTWGALRLSWALILGPLLLLWWFTRRGIPWPHLQNAVPARLFRRQLGPGWSRTCGVAGLLLLALSVGLPLAQILSLRRTWTELPGAVAAGWSDIWNSVWLPAVSAGLVIALGLGCVALRTRSRSFVDSLLWLPFLVPGVLLGMGLIVCFNHAWSAFFYQSAGIVVLAFVLRYLGLGWNAVTHAARTVDRDLLAVARLEGASRWQTLRHVHWPQIAPQAVTAWYIVFLLCLWDVESMLLVVPPGGETLALRIFNLLHYGYNAQVNALCLTLLLVALTPLLLWQAWRLLCGPSSGSSIYLRRFTFHASRFTSRAPLLALLLAPASLLCSCSAPSSSTDVPLRGPLFSRAKVLGARGVGVGQLNKPRSLALDREDHLYVVDMTGRVQKFSPNGVFELLWQMPQTDLGKPKGMGRDAEGNILVIEPHYQRVNHFSTTGKLLAQWGEKGTNVGQFWMPRAVAVDSHGALFVSEYGAVERVQKFAFAGPLTGSPRCLLSFGKPGNGPGEFNRPEGLCIDARDRLYVADSCNHRIQVFSDDGRFLRAYGKAGAGKGELSYPYDICVDAAGRQYVCEFGNSRIQVFDANDQPIDIIGGPGAEPGRFSNPWSLGLDSAGNLYVADSQNHRVQKLVAREAGVAGAQQSRQAREIAHSLPTTAQRLGASDSGPSNR